MTSWLDRAGAFFEAHVPHDPRLFRALDYILPAVLTILLIVNFINIGRVSNLADEAKQTAEATRVIVKENQTFNKRLTWVLITNCQRSGNPLRRVIQGLLTEQIESARNTPASFFPNIPPQVFHRLIRKQIAANVKRRRQSAPINCRHRYLRSSPREK